MSSLSLVYKSWLLSAILALTIATEVTPILGKTAGITRTAG